MYCPHQLAPSTGGSSLSPYHSTLLLTVQPRLSYVQQALLQEEMKLKGAPSSSSAVGPKALYGKHKRMKHQPQSSNVKCYNCKEMGHYARYCPKKSPHGRSKTTHNAKATDKESTGEREATENFFTAGLCSLSDTCFVDSGASSHMTSKRELLTHYEDFKIPENVSLGDGRTVEALGIGNVYLNMTFKCSPSKHCLLTKVLFMPKLATNLFLS